MEIWRDGIHIAINKDTQIYTKDVLKMLNLELLKNSSTDVLVKYIDSFI